MLRASTPTKLSLARWAAIMGISPLHFAGVQLADIPASNCNQTWSQYDWQQVDRVSREEVAQAIRRAEDDIEQQLGYRLLPAWETDEWTPTIRHYDPTRYAMGWDVRGGAMPAETHWKWGVAGGVRGTTLIAGDADITWSDEDGDGYDETGTVSIATSVADCELRLFAPGHAADPTWEIKPIRVSSAAGTATITFRRELAVKDEFSEWVIPPEPIAADGLEDDDFYDSVAIYRVWNDPSTQVSFLWEPGTAPCGCSGGCSTCAYGAQTGCFLWRDPKLGILIAQSALWSAENAYYQNEPLAIGRAPDLLRLFYYAGLRDRGSTCPNVELTQFWAMIVARYAASMLDRPPCSCSQDQWARWAEDLAFTGGVDETSTYNLSPGDLRSVFGTRRGAIEAWRAVRRDDLQIPRTSAGAYA